MFKFFCNTNYFVNFKLFNYLKKALQVK